MKVVNQVSHFWYYPCFPRSCPFWQRSNKDACFYRQKKTQCSLGSNFAFCARIISLYSRYQKLFGFIWLILFSSLKSYRRIPVFLLENFLKMKINDGINKSSIKQDAHGIPEQRLHVKRYGFFIIFYVSREGNAKKYLLAGAVSRKCENCRLVPLNHLVETLLQINSVMNLLTAPPMDALM